MKFTILVLGAPDDSAAPASALAFARAVIAEGHEIVRIFFQGPGVLTADAKRVPPQDETDIGAEYAAFASAQQVELVVCIASALRRGVLDEDEARRYERGAASLRDGFTIAGLGQLVDGALAGDRLVSFGG